MSTDLDHGNGEAFNPIVELLIREGHLTAEQARYAHRVGSRLHMTKPLCDVVRELGYVTDEQIRQTIRRNQGDLRIGDLLGGLGYLTDEELNRALALQMQSQISEVFAMDIHPAARIGRGIMVDHGTAVVIGETAVVEDDVSMLHEVTLGGTGKEIGDRHPKVRKGVLIGAGAKIIGNIEIGEGAKIGSGAVVLAPVPPHTTVAGVPAKIVGKPTVAAPAKDMDQHLEE